MQVQVTYVQVFWFWCEKQQRLSANLRPKAAPAGGGLRRKRAHEITSNSASSSTKVAFPVVVIAVVAAAIVHVMASASINVLCFVRPPAHHMTPDRKRKPT